MSGGKKVKIRKGKSLRLRIEFIKAFIIAISIIIIVCPIATKAYFQNLYEISIGGKTIGYALSKDDVHEAYKQARIKESKKTDQLVIVEKEIELKQIKGNTMKAFDTEELAGVLYDQFKSGLKKDARVVAYTIKINNYTATLASKEDVLKVLEKVQSTYDTEDKFTVDFIKDEDRETPVLGITVLGATANATQNLTTGETTTEEVTTATAETTEAASTEATTEATTEPTTEAQTSTDGILNIDFQEDIQITEVYVDPDTISTSKEVYSNITTARNEESIYIVRSGDSLSVIAEDHGMKLDDLLAVNPDLDLESAIYIDDEIKVVVPKTEISVLMEEQKTYTEDYWKETEYIDDSSLFVGDDVVTQEATQGQRTVTAIISYNNGEEYNREITNEIVIVEAQAKVVHVGTKAIPTYMWPLSNPRVTSEFGQRWGRLHAGLDFGCGVGTTVRATRGGTVISAGWLGGYGNCVVIDHGDGVTSRYGHLSEILVSSGQYVKQGDKIALSGNTGRSTGPHLHFEMRVNGSPVDPRGYLN